MKRLRFSRKQVLRAIHLACLALFFAACSQKAQAQTYNHADFSLSGANVTDKGMTDASGAYFVGSGTNSYTFTISSGVTLGNTGSSHGGNLLSFNSGSVTTSNSTYLKANNDVIKITGNGTVTNSTSASLYAINGDTIHIGGTGSVYNASSITPDTGIYAKTGEAIYIGGATGNIVSNTNAGYIGSGGTDVIHIVGDGTVTNTGESGIIDSGSGRAIYIGGTGLVTNTHSYIYSENGDAIHIVGTGTVNNAQSGHSFGIVAANYAIYIGGATGNTVTNTNGGYIESSNNDAIHIVGDGTVTNTGSSLSFPSEITGNNNGIYIGGATGSISNTNYGSISGDHGAGVDIKGYGTVTNTTSIIASANGEGVHLGGGGTVTNSGDVGFLNPFGIIGEGGDAVYITGGTGTVSNYNHGQIFTTGYDAVHIVDDGFVTNTGSSYIFSLSSSSPGTGRGIYIGGNGQVTSSGSGFIAAAAGDAIDINGNGNISNTGSSAILSEAGDAVHIGGNGTIFNSGGGMLTFSAYGSSLPAGIYSENGDGIYIGGSGSSTVTNSGGYIGAGYTSSAIVQAIHIAGSGTVSNTYGGIIRSTGNAIDIVGTGNVTNSSSSDIDSTTIDGIYIKGAGTVTNSGTIFGGKYGVDLRGTNSFLLTSGGSITGTTKSIVLGGSSSSIEILGRTTINGVMEGNDVNGPHGQKDTTGNTLVLDLAGGTPGELSALKAAIADPGSGSGTFGGETYSWQDFSSITDNAISFELVVDPGLKQVAIQLDTNPLPSSFDSFYTAAFSNPEGAINALVGREFDGTFANIALGNATAFADLVDGHSFSGGGIDLTGLDITSSSMIASLGQTQSLLSKLMGPSLPGGTTMSDSKEVATPTAEMNRWGVWASGTLTLADSSNTFDSPGYNSTTESPTLGADYRVNRDLTVGALFNYATTGAYFSDGSRLDAQNELLGVYANWSHGPWYVNGLAGGGLAQYDNKRTTLGGAQAQSDPDGNEILADVAGGYEFKVGDGWRVSPEVGLQYTHLEEDSYNESGGGLFNLDIGGQTVDSLRSKVGFRATENFRWDGISFTPQFHAAWYHEFLDNSFGVTTSLPGAPALGSFVVGTTNPERDFALVGAGLSAMPSELHDDVTFFLNYDAQVGQDNYIAHTVNGGVKVDF